MLWAAGVPIPRPAGGAALAALALFVSAARGQELPPSPTLPARLDLDGALQLLRGQGLDVLAAEAAIQAAEGELRVAGAIANPTLSGTYGRSYPRGRCVNDAGSPVSCEPLSDPALGIGLSDNAALFDALTGKRGLRQDVAKAALAAARLQRDDALRTLETQVKQAFEQVLLTRDTLAFDEEVAAAQARTAALSRARFENGAISEADVARIDTARLEADQAVDGARADLRNARVALAFLLGVRGPVPEYDVVPGPLTSSAVPERLASETRESLLARALESRPDVLAAQRQKDRADAALSLALRQRIPDVTVSASYFQQGTTNTAVSPPTFALGLSLPLPLFSQQQGEVRRAEADQRTQGIALARAQASVVSDLESAWAGYGAARAHLERMEGGLLERSKTARDLVTIQYQKGAASLLDLLDAQRTFIATRIEYLQDLAAYWNAVFKLEQAAGVTLR